MLSWMSSEDCILTFLAGGFKSYVDVDLTSIPLLDVALVKLKSKTSS